MIDIILKSTSHLQCQNTLNLSKKKNEAYFIISKYYFTCTLFKKWKIDVPLSFVLSESY